MNVKFVTFLIFCGLFFEGVYFQPHPSTGDQNSGSWTQPEETPSLAMQVAASV